MFAFSLILAEDVNVPLLLQKFAEDEVLTIFWRHENWFQTRFVWYVSSSRSWNVLQSVFERQTSLTHASTILNASIDHQYYFSSEKNETDLTSPRCGALFTHFVQSSRHWTLVRLWRDSYCDPIFTFVPTAVRANTAPKRPEHNFVYSFKLFSKLVVNFDGNLCAQAYCYARHKR